MLSLAARTPVRSPVPGARRELPEPRRAPRVTVAIACHQYGRFLGECLASVVAQDGVDLEVIVVDDASTDETPRVAAAFAAADERVRVIRHERNAGHIATFNEGLGEARGEYVLKLDADDLLAPGALRRAAAVMEQDAQIGLVYGHPHYFEGAPPRPPVGDGGERFAVWDGREWLRERCRRAVNCISNPEALVRRDLLDVVGLYDPRLPHTFDFEMWMRLAAVSDVARVEGAVQGFYRVHPDSFQRTIHAGVITDLRGRRDAFEVLFEGVAGGLPEAAELHDLARERLAREALDRACRAYDRGRVEEEPVEQLAAFARQVWPRAEQLPEWRALACRRRVGERYAPWTPPFVARALLRRVREERRMTRWLRYGL